MAKKKAAENTEVVEAEVDKEKAEVAPYKKEATKDAEAAPKGNSVFSRTGILALALIVTAAVAGAYWINETEPTLASSVIATDQEADSVATSDVPTTAAPETTEVVSTTTQDTTTNETTATDTLTVATQETAPQTVQPFAAPVPAPVPWGYAYAPVPYGYGIHPGQKYFDEMIKRDQEAIEREQEVIQRERQKRLELAQSRFKFDETVLRDNRKNRPDIDARHAEWRAQVDKRRAESEKQFKEMIKQNQQAREAFEKAVRQGI